MTAYAYAKGTCRSRAGNNAAFESVRPSLVARIAAAPGDDPAFAVHDDGNVAAFHGSDIASALGLRADCVIGS